MNNIINNKLYVININYNNAVLNKFKYINDI